MDYIIPKFPVMTDELSKISHIVDTSDELAWVQFQTKNYSYLANNDVCLAFFTLARVIKLYRTGTNPDRSITRIRNMLILLRFCTNEQFYQYMKQN